MHEIPSFKPYSYGSSLGLCPIYCSSKEEWNFLVKAIVHRKQLEDVVKALDTDRDEKSTKALVGEVVNYFGTNMEKLHEKSNTQIEHLVKQSESLLDFLKSQSLASSLSLAHEAKISTPPNHHHQAPPPQQQTNSPPPQQQILESPSQHQILPSLPQQHSLPPSDPSHACDEDMDHLKAFFQEEKKTDKKNENLVSQDYLSFLTEMLTKDGDSLDFEELKRTCKRVKLTPPKKLPTLVTAQQTKNFIYKLAVTIKKQKNDSKRYLYTPTFSYKSELVATSMFQSESLTNKYPIISKKYHSKFRHFLKQCENLDTSPSNIEWLISLLSKSFYRRETVMYNGTYGSFNKTPYYAMHFSKILCMLMKKLIISKDNAGIVTLYELMYPLFCDIVIFHVLVSPKPKNFFVKHEKIITLFRSLQEKYKDDPSCANSFLYYIFSIFCKHSYIGETMDMIRRKLEHTKSSCKEHPTSFLYSILHSIGIEHFTFICTPIPPFLRKPLEHQLISWFKPSLNSLHNSNFKSDVFSNPSIPDILKTAVITFKATNSRCLATYNINSPIFKTPSTLCVEYKKRKSSQQSSTFSTSFTQYYDPDRNLTTVNLLALVSEYSDKLTFKPFFVIVNFGQHDVTNFCFLQNEMPDSSAFGPDADNGSLVQLTITQLITRLKDQSIQHFLFLPAAPHILLDYHATSVILPSIAKGSVSPIALLKSCHPYRLFKLYKQCYKMQSPLLQSLAKQKLSDLCFKFFKIRPTKVILFSIKLNEILSRNKIKTILFSFLKTLPISQELLLLLQSQTKVTFRSHPKAGSIFCNHISWCKKWSEKPFPCKCSSLSPLLGLDTSCKHISTLGHLTSSIFDSVLHSNLNNVCSPNVKSFPEEFLNSFMTYYHGILDLCESFKEPIPFVPLITPQIFSLTKPSIANLTF